MIDFRAHLASIVAVFLALGLGMLIGAQLADEGALAREYGRLIEQIEAGLEGARRDNRRLETRVADAERRLAAESQFVDDVLGELLEGKLEGVLVELVAEDADTAEGRIRSALQRAGASLVARFDERPESGATPPPVPPLQVVLRGGEAELGTDGGPSVSAVDTARGMFALIELLQETAAASPLAGMEEIQR